MKRVKGRAAKPKPRPAAPRGISQADLDRMLTCVSHEFRTPLNSIITLSDLALGGAEGGPEPAEVIEFMSIIRADGRRLLHLVEKLILLADLEAGKALYYLAPVAVEDALHTAREALGAADMKTEIDPGLLVRADAVKLATFMRELLENALLHGVPGGQVAFQARARGNRAELVFTNAMDPAQRADPKKVFKKFEQGNSGDLTAKPPGLGIGLNICKHIARSMRGALSCARPAADRWVAAASFPLAREKDVG